MPAVITADETSRLMCGTGNYHCIVAISESMLNARLITYYNLLDAFKSTNVKHPIYGGINATLNPPKIELPARDQNKSTVYCIFCVKEGTLTYPGEGGVLEGISISGWEIAFTCNLGLESVNGANLEALQNGLNVPGEYSIQRLLINFADANLTSIDKDRSKMPMKDGGKVTFDLQIALGFWIGNWLTTWETIEEHLYDGYKLPPNLQRKEYPLLYHAIAPQPEDVTFPLNPTATRPSQGTDGNYHLYLEMCGTDNKRKASTLPPILAFECTGNFDTSDNRKIDGTMCFSSDLFFDKYLTEYLTGVLKPVVKASELVLQSVLLRTDNTIDWSYDVGNNMDHPDANDDYYKMKRVTQPDEVYSHWFNAGEESMKNEHGWRWISQAGRGEHGEQVINTQVPCVVGNEIIGKDFNMSGRSLCNLTYIPGGNVLTLDGYTTVVLSMRPTSVEATSKHQAQAAITATWRVQFVFKAVVQGQIFIETVYPDDFVQTTGFVNNSTAEFDVTAAKTRLQNSLTDKLMALKPRLDELGTTLEKHMFVLSGGGYFHMANPIFSEHGDLLLELAYKGGPEDDERSCMENRTGLMDAAVLVAGISG